MGRRRPRQALHGDRPRRAVTAGLPNGAALDHPSELTMELPAEIGSRRWDVILVDGPAGQTTPSPAG